MKNLFIIVTLGTLILSGCSSFKAERLDSKSADEKASEITDAWVLEDTRLTVKDLLTQLSAHKGFQRYLATAKNKTPKVFIAEVQNQTAEAYFPINDMNDEFLTEISASGDFILIDAAAREKLLGEIKYQNDGMVDPNEAKRVGKQSGADLMIFGNVYMKPESRGGKTLKQYSVNLRMTDIEKGVEVLRIRKTNEKYSKQ